MCRLISLNARNSILHVTSLKRRTAERASSMSIQPVASASFNITGRTLIAVLHTVGGTADFYGINPGFGGSITPATYGWETIFDLSSRYLSGVIDSTTLAILGANLPQGFFTSLTANGFTLLSAAADTFTSNGSGATWKYNGVPMFPAIGTYPVVIVWVLQ